MKLPLNSDKEVTTLRLFYVMATYIILQVTWWGVLLVAEKKQNIWSNQNLTEFEKQELFSQKKWMIFGEGFVFLVLLLIGFLYLKRSITRKLQLARREQTFLLSVTHELKTPIAAIKLFLDTINTRKMNEEQILSLSKNALKESQRLDSMTENILITTRLDQKSDGLHFETLLLASLIRQVSTRLKNLTGANIIEYLDEELSITADKELMLALISNLLENAIKYSDSESKIEIALKQNDHSIFLIISDNGPGIPDDEKKYIFDKFYRIGNENTRKHKGTGLGLYLAKNIVHLHKGKITVSDHKPTGTTFTIEFNRNRS